MLNAATVFVILVFFTVLAAIVFALIGAHLRQAGARYLIILLNAATMFLIGTLVGPKSSMALYRAGAADAEEPFNLFESSPPMPPDAFMGDGSSRVRFVAAYQAIGSCGFNAIACYIKERNIVVIANPCQEAFRLDEYALLLCHELAHVNGWRHEDAVNFQTFTGTESTKASLRLRD